MAVTDPYEWPVGLKAVNAILIDARQNNQLQSEYNDTAQVLTENPAAIRKKGQIYLVADGSGGILRYWFRIGLGDGDLEILSDFDATVYTSTYDSIVALKASSVPIIGEQRTTRGYYAGDTSGSGLYQCISLTSGGFTDNAGTIIVAANNSVWSLNSDRAPLITQFGCRMDAGVTDNTVLLQNAFDSSQELLIPDGDCYVTGTLLYNKRQTLTGVGKAARLSCLLPDLSSTKVHMMPTGVQLQNMTFNLIANGYSGTFIEWNSEYLDLVNKTDQGAGNTNWYQRTLDAYVHNLFIEKQNDTSGLNDFAETALKWLHTGKGTSVYGAVYDKLNIVGEWGQAIHIAVEQQYVDGEPNQVVPWWTGQTYNNILINKAKNGILIGTANLTGSTLFVPLAPGYFNFYAVQQQVAKLVSERFLHITNGKRINVTNCHAWDWDQAAVGFESKAFQISNISGGDLDTEQINLTNSATAGQHVVFDAGMPVVAYGTTYLGTNNPAYGGSNNLTLVPISGTGNVIFTYRDLLQLAPGKYSGSQDQTWAKALNIQFETNITQVVELEVTTGYQNRRIYIARRISSTNSGSIQDKNQGSMYIGGFGTTNLESQAFWDDDIAYNFWRDGNGDSPNDLRITTTVLRSVDPRNGFGYYDSTLIKYLTWDSTNWVDSVGRISIGTVTEWNAIAPKVTGFTFYDTELASVRTATVYDEFLPITFANLIIADTADDVFPGDKYRLTDLSDELIVIEAHSPDGSTWFNRIDNAGVLTPIKIV